MIRKRNHILLIILILILFIVVIPNVVAAQNSPKVLFDETGAYYGKYYTIYNTGNSGSSIFANLLQENGFRVYKLNEKPITPEKLQGYDVVILMAPYRNYTDSEINSFKEYVKNGGGLFIAGHAWGVEDGNSFSLYNKVVRSFGMDFAYNEIVADQKNYLGLPGIVRVTDIKSHPITTKVPKFYYILGTYLKKPGSSSVIAYSSADSWADNLALTSEGFSLGNDIKDPKEISGPLPLYSTMIYGKGKVVVTGSAPSFSNQFIYRSNEWILGLNSVNWLSNRPIPATYKKAGLISLNLGDLGYRFLALIFMTILILASLFYTLRWDKRQISTRTIKTIKNWKYYGIIILNVLFVILGILIFIPINFALFDRLSTDYYDPQFGYVLLFVGILFIIFSGILLYRIILRQRIDSKYNFYNIALLIFFVGITSIIGDIFAFPMVYIFTIGSIFLLIPFLINIWIIKGHGPDLIIEGKEFNRLSKISVNSLPYELHGSYSNPNYIGEGGFGRVFKATRLDGEEVAIKIPKSFDKRSEKTFITEVSNWSQLIHPNIVKLYDFKILPIPYIEMEYCEGSIGHDEKSVDKSIEIIYESAKGLGYAHSKNIIHGDVKTSNIMSKNGVYKVSDWGLSKMTTGESITLSGATPQYAAPEQISHQFGKADERTDIYQLGTVFYEIITGQLPFEGDMAVIYGSILNSTPIPPSKINPKATLVEPIIMKCLSKNKDQRYSSMDELLKELEDYRNPVYKDETVIFKK